MHPRACAAGSGAPACELGRRARQRPTSGNEAAPSSIAGNEPTGPEGASTGRKGTRSGKTREGTKQALLVGILRRAEGATIAEVVEATGWQPHTVRGALAGALKKRLGLIVASEKVDGRGRVYRLPG